MALPDCREAVNMYTLKKAALAYTEVGNDYFFWTASVPIKS